MMTEPFTADHYNRLLMNCFCRFACLKQRAKEVCCQTKKYSSCHISRTILIKLYESGLEMKVPCILCVSFLACLQRMTNAFNYKQNVFHILNFGINLLAFYYEWLRYSLSIKQLNYEFEISIVRQLTRTQRESPVTHRNRVQII